ncbi:hemin uptake protein HemP [Pseudomonas sp. YJ42]|uniref:hemin uptake protein HemP n=1 Tax=Pseudomonas sp. YJ42 TaxID=3392115 RepID=UPI0039A31D90
MTLLDRYLSDTTQTQTQPTGSVAIPPRRRVCSDQLLGGLREMVIVHDGCEYVLRLTRQNKLILTK